MKKYEELEQRIEREKQLDIVAQKLEVKRQLMVRSILFEECMLLLLYLKSNLFAKIIFPQRF